MKKHTRILAILLLLFSVGALNAAYETWGISVRARGMGDAMAATHGDINSLAHNPAGIARLDTVQFMGNYVMPFLGTDEGGISIFNVYLAAPFVNNALINWPGTLFNLLSFGLTKPVFQKGAWGLGVYMLGEDIYYERAFSLTLSRRLDNLLNSGLNFSIGMRFNLFMRGINDNEYTAGNPYFDNGTSSTGFGMDIGLIMHLSAKFHIGVYMNNVIEPDIAINDSVASELINRSLRYGITWNVGDIVVKGKTIMERLTVAYTYSAFGKDDSDIREEKGKNSFGFEFWQFRNILGVRAGYEFGDDLSNITAGISADFAFGDHEIQIDYAFVFPTTMTSTAGSHLVSLVYKLRLAKSAFEFDPRKHADMKRLEKLQKQQGSGGGDAGKPDGTDAGSGDKKDDTGKKDTPK